MSPLLLKALDNSKRFIPVEWPVPSFSLLSRCQGRCADEFHLGASHSGAKGGRTKRWSFGRAAIAARSSSSSWVRSASRLAFWLSGRAAFRNHDDALLIEEPSDRHLSGTTTVLV